VVRLNYKLLHIEYKMEINVKSVIAVGLNYKSITAV